MRRARVWTLVVATVTGLVVSSGVAYALWSDTGSARVPGVERGAVMFAASPEEGEPRYSQDGAAVTVTMPGSQIARIATDYSTMGRVIWKFKTWGYAMGSAGMAYTLSYTPYADATPDQIDTVLEGSTLKVYQGSVSDDTGAVDCAPPQDEPAAVDGVVSLDARLQEPGDNPLASAEVVQGLTQWWCVEVAWDGDPPAPHVNVATVTATSADGLTVEESDVFTALVRYPVRLAPVGPHTNQATVVATGTDGLTTHAQDDWTALVHRAPVSEPGLSFTLTPAVI